MFMIQGQIEDVGDTLCVCTTKEIAEKFFEIISTSKNFEIYDKIILYKISTDKLLHEGNLKVLIST